MPPTITPATSRAGSPGPRRPAVPPNPVWIPPLGGAPGGLLDGGGSWVGGGAVEAPPPVSGPLFWTMVVEGAPAPPGPGSGARVGEVPAMSACSWLGLRRPPGLIQKGEAPAAAPPVATRTRRHPARNEKRPRA